MKILSSIMLIQKKAKDVWATVEEESYNKLKEILISMLILQIFEPEKYVDLCTNINSRGFATCLLPKDNETSCTYCVISKHCSKKNCIIILINSTCLPQSVPYTRFLLPISIRLIQNNCFYLLKSSGAHKRGVMETASWAPKRLWESEKL